MLSAARRFSYLITVALILCAPSWAAETQWLRISSDHFIVVTDAGQKRGREIAARFEQMRAAFGDLLRRQQVHMGDPIEILAIASPEKYAQIVPPNGPVTKPGIILSSDDRIFIVLNAADPESWRTVEHSMAHYFLDRNYPPTQPWFDEGFAEYFSSLDFTAQKTEAGGDPELFWPRGGKTDPDHGLKSLTGLLENPAWLNLTDVLEMKNRRVNGEEGTHHTLFYAQSWMLMHYLINQDKLSEAGTYLGLVKLQKVAVADAIQQAFGMSAAQLDQAVKDYFHSLKPLKASLEESQQPNPPLGPEPVKESALPFSVDEVSVTANQLKPAEADALLDEVELRLPEKREQATQDLQKLIAGDKSETAVAHRALAWAHLQKGETKDAFDEFNEAIKLSPADPETRLEIALATYGMGESGGKIQGLANMMESLHIVLDRYSEFAEAYNMLGWAQMTGGGPNAAIESFKRAVQFGPREELYQLRLGQAYIGARKWDEGTEILERVQASSNPQLAAVAQKELHDLPFIKKYGIPPQENAAGKERQENTGSAASTKNEGTQAKVESADSSDDSPDDDSEITVTKTPAAPSIDKRPIQFLTAKLESVDCSQAPAATLLIAKGARKLKLRTSDYSSVAVLGAEKFSCEWKNVSVSVNYRSKGNSEGDLVSVELH